MARTNEDFKTAVEAMFRVRAVESPPDEQGVRRVWHRGTRGAEAITDLDATDRVLSHQLVLFDEVITWNRERGLGTGTTLQPDDEVDARKLARAAVNLAPYSGNDRLLAHLRKQILAKSPQLRTQVAPRPPLPTRKSVRPRSLIWLLVAGLALAAIGLLLLLTH